MRVSTGFIHGYAVADFHELLTYVQECERIGLSSVWSPEGWGHDGATPLAFLAGQTSRIGLGTGVLQIGARTPANVAMTALSLQQMSNGRFMLGLGTSGPQVIEGLHGLRFEKVHQRTRELIEIVKRMCRGDAVTYEGEIYRLPVREGEGKALSLAAQPAPDIPIYLGSLAPMNLRLLGEVADGWRGAAFMPEHADVFFDYIREGCQKSGRAFEDLDLSAGGTVWFTEDVDEAIRALKPGLAYTVGAMGSRAHNFYNQAYSRAGYADVCAEIQDLWLSGRHREGYPLVPDDMVVKSHLVGTDEMVRERIRAHRRAGITTLHINLQSRRTGRAGLTVERRIETLERFLDLARQVDEEAV